MMVLWWLPVAFAADLEYEIGVTGRAAFVYRQWDWGVYPEFDEGIQYEEGFWNNLPAPNPLIGVDFSAASRKHWIVGLAVDANPELGALTKIAGKFGWKDVRFFGESGRYDPWHKLQRDLYGDELPRFDFRRTYVTALTPAPGFHLGIGNEMRSHRPADTPRNANTEYRLHGFIFRFSMLEDAMSEDGQISMNQRGGVQSKIHADGDMLIGFAQVSDLPAVEVSEFDSIGYLPTDLPRKYGAGFVQHTKVGPMFVWDNPDGTRWGVNVGVQLHIALTVPMSIAPDIAVSPYLAVRGLF